MLGRKQYVQIHDKYEMQPLLLLF